MTKRLLILCLLAVLLITTVSSCTNAKTGNDASSTISDTESNDPPPPPPPEFELPEITLANTTVNMLCAGEFDDYQKRMHEGMNRDYGIEVVPEVVAYNQLSTILTQKIASNEAPDLYTSKSDDYPGLLSKDLFLPLKDYIDLEDKVWANVIDKMTNWQWKGEYYLAGGGSGVARFLWYNKKIFRDADLETPIELYDKGEWTWDKLLEYAKELTIEDADGKIIQYGFAGESLQFSLRGSIGEDYVKITPNGLENNFRSPNIAKAEKFLQDLFITHKVVPLGDEISQFSMFMQNKVAMGIYGHWYAFSAEGATERLKNGEIEFAPPPKFEGMEPYYYGDISGMLIPKGAKNPEGAGAYLTYQAYYGRVQEKANEDNTEVSPWMKENIEAGWTNDMVRIYTEVNNSPNIICHMYHGIGDASSWAWEPYAKVTTGIPWETVVEEYAPKMEQAIQIFNSNSK